MPSITTIPVELKYNMFEHLKDEERHPLAIGHHPFSQDDLVSVFHTCRSFRNIVRPLVMHRVDVADYAEWMHVVEIYNIDDTSKSYLRCVHFDRYHLLAAIISVCRSLSIGRHIPRVFAPTWIAELGLVIIPFDNLVEFRCRAFVMTEDEVQHVLDTNQRLQILDIIMAPVSAVNPGCISATIPTCLSHLRDLQTLRIRVSLTEQQCAVSQEVMAESQKILPSLTVFAIDVADTETPKPWLVYYLSSFGCPKLLSFSVSMVPNSLLGPDPPFHCLAAFVSRHVSIRELDISTKSAGPLTVLNDLYHLAIQCGNQPTNAGLYCAAFQNHITRCSIQVHSTLHPRITGPPSFSHLSALGLSFRLSGMEDTSMEFLTMGVHFPFVEDLRLAGSGPGVFVYERWKVREPVKVIQ